MLDLLEPLEMPKIGLDSPIVELLMQLERLRGCNSFIGGSRGADGSSGVGISDAAVVNVAISGAATPEVWLSQFREIALKRWKSAGVPLTGDSAMGSCVNLADSSPIDEDFIRALHRTFAGESGGTYRHPEYIPGLMWDLARFLRLRFPAQFDFLKVALVFRRLLWIHPFPIGNVEVARALAFAMLSRILGEGVVSLLDPEVAFVDEDSDNKQGLLKGCELFLQGLVKDLRRCVELVCAGHVRGNLLVPALQDLAKARAVTPEESAALAIALERPEFQALDLAPVWGDQFLRSRSIRKMLESGLIKATKAGGRKYTLNIACVLRS